MKENTQEKILKLEEENRVLKGRIKKLKHDLIHDQLTGLKTRKYLTTRVKSYLKSLSSLNGTNRNIDKKGYREHIGFLFCDIDYFKKVNDTLGHEAGDEVLKKVSRALEENVRDKDIVARFGGEEIVIALLEAHLEDSQKIAEKIRKAVEDLEFEGYPDLQVTISIGVSSTEAPCEDESTEDGRTDRMFDEYMRRSDSAVYAAKNKGRNRVVVWSPELERIQHSPSVRAKLLKVFKERRK